MNEFLTILTPTYNRIDTLPTLYNSLLQQTDKGFTWVVVDDGSADDTASLIAQYREIGDIDIVYINKKNGGKHTALNVALEQVTSRLTFIVDSDDYLTPDAVEQIHLTYEQYKDKKDICGFSFLRQTPDGQAMIARRLRERAWISTYVNVRVNAGLIGDMAEVWYTDQLKANPFPEFAGERFLGEDVVWIKLSGDFRMVFIDKVIYISQYLDNGLTKNRRRNNIKSPKGCVLRAEVFLNANVNFRHKLKAAMQYTIYSRFAGNSFGELISKSKHRFWVVVTFPAAMVLYWIWKKQYA